MSLANLGPLGFVLGCGALAGVLYLLQRLRVRHREVPVVTTLFWKEAVEEARARVFVQRFRHLWAYLLVLLIAGLLWLAFAEPRGTGRGPTDHVVLVDGSAGMGAPGRMDAAREALAEELTNLPRRATTVLWCGATTRTLLAPGESALLLDKRFAELAPEATPPTIESTLLALGDAREVDRPLELVVVGDAAVTEDALALLDGDVSVRRATAAAAALDNAGIVALGVGPSTSGAWNQVDVYIEVAGAEASDLELSWDDERSGAGLSDDLLSPAEGRAGVRYRNLPANGQTLGFRLARGGALEPDDEARIRLPKRSLLRVVVSDSLAEVFDPVLAADPAVVRVSSDPDVVIRLAGESLFADRPAIVLAPAAEQEEAVLLVHAADEDSSDVLADAFGELGLDRIDAAGLAEQAARPITAGARPGPVAQVALWRELVDRSQFQFVESRAFPILVARSLRWLAEVEAVVPYAATGESLKGVAALAAGGVRFDALGATLAAPRPGAYARGDGETVHVSLLSAAVSAPSAAGALTTDERVGSGDGWDGVTWILLLALALLGLEWHLSRTGRMP